MAWRCSFGVENCPICRRHQESEQAVAAKKRAEKILARIQDGLARGTIKAVFKNGKITFQGLTPAEREGATEECAYRAILVSGTAMARAAIARAEQIAGVTKRVIER